MKLPTPDPAALSAAIEAAEKWPTDPGSPACASCYFWEEGADKDSTVDAAATDPHKAKSG
jgi:hypothetical protein